MAKTPEAERDWLPLRTVKTNVGGPSSLTWIVAIGANEFVVERRRRRRGTYIDNAFAGWRETWVKQNGVDLAFLDTGVYPPPKWEVQDGDESWVGVRGHVEGHDVLLAKPYRVGVKRTPLIGVTVAARVFVISRDGALHEGTEIVARLPRRGHEGAVNPDADDIVWLLALLLHSTAVMDSFENALTWESLLDPSLWIEGIGNLLLNSSWP